MADLPENYTLHALPGEPPLVTKTGRWEYLSVHVGRYVHSHRYFHVDCDCLTDDEGRCMLCKALPF